jgi:hypothetical protein
MAANGEGDIYRQHLRAGKAAGVVDPRRHRRSKEHIAVASKPRSWSAGTASARAVEGLHG